MDTAVGEPSPEESAQLRLPGFDPLARGRISAQLAASSAPADRVRLALYEQFAAREQEANDRLIAVRDDPRTPADVRRRAWSLHRMGVAFGPEFAREPIDWNAEEPPTELDSVGIRERVAILGGRLIADGREPAGGWPDDFRPPDWPSQELLISESHDGLLARLADADAHTLLEDLDLHVWVPMVLMMLVDHRRALAVIGAARDAHARHGIRVLDHFLDYMEAATLLGLLDVARAVPLLESALEGFRRDADRRWWMLAKSIQALLASVSRSELPDDLDELERALVSGEWRRGRRSLGQATLILMSLALAHHGDHEGALRVALADGGLEELAVPSSDRISVIEAICTRALAEGDIGTCKRMLGIADRMMGSPLVAIGRERIRSALQSYREGAPPPPVAVLPEGSTIDALRTRWMLLAQTVTHGSRDQAWSALAEFESFAGRAELAAVRQRAIRLFRARASAADPSALSPRMLEVASLAAAGLTNREIAAQLFLGVRTVEGYVSESLRALGLQRRSDLAGVELPLRLRAAGDAAAAPVLVPLRQGQVGSLIAAGASNAEIAAVLEVTEKTVDKHIAALKERIGVGTRTGIAAAFAG